EYGLSWTPARAVAAVRRLPALPRRRADRDAGRPDRGLDRGLPAEDEVEDRPQHGEDDHDQEPGPELSARELGAPPDHVDHRDDPADRRHDGEAPEPVHSAT